MNKIVVEGEPFMDFDGVEYHLYLKDGKLIEGMYEDIATKHWKDISLESVVLDYEHKRVRVTVEELPEGEK